MSDSAAATPSKSNVSDIKRPSPPEASGSGSGSSTQRRAQDPVTGAEIDIVDAAHVPEERWNEATNVLTVDIPPPEWSAQKNYLVSLSRAALWKTCVGYIACPLIFFSLPLPSVLRTYPLAPLLISLIPPTFVAYVLLFGFETAANNDMDERVWHSERQRGLKAGRDSNNDGHFDQNERTKESAEWFNDIFRGIWPIINSDMFTGMIDMVEDIMQSSVPTFIHSVRISDLGQGNNPLRITAIRSLPDAQLSEAAQKLEDQHDMFKNEHVNLEISFAYRSTPSGKTASSKAQNAHLLVEFFVGLKGVFGVGVPIWVEITGAVGTARARIELIPDPPFMKTTLITLLGLPKVSISIVPLHKKILPNIMKLPFLSKFISDSIDAACAEYVAPKSLTLDLQRLLSGDDIKRDTDAIGVVVLHIHSARNLKKNAERSGGLDPYATVCFSPLNKPLYSTRIIIDECNPDFEETAALLVDASAVMLGEKLSIQLWDSDRVTADDLLGTVDVDIAELMQQPNTPRRLTTPFKHKNDRHPGELEYTVAYFPKASPAGEGLAPTEVPDEMKQTQEFKKAREGTLTDLEAAVEICPPRPDLLTGILSIQIHEIRELGVRVTESRNLFGRREGKEGKEPEDDENAEDEEKLPSSYCNILINDDKIYKTRVKPLTSTPFFNATTEKLIKDWTQTHVVVVVRDSRVRENDPVLGLVSLKLSDIFKEGSVKSRFYSIQGGIGFGKVRITTTFRPVQAKLPKSLLGYDTATLEVQHIAAKPSKPFALEKHELHLQTSSSAKKLSKKEGSEINETAEEDRQWLEGEDAAVYLPVEKRYRSSLIIKFRERGIFGKDTKAMGVLWLRDLVDGQRTTLTVTLWEGDDFSRLKQNYLPPLNGPEQVTSEKVAHLEPIGTIDVTVTLWPGLSKEHQSALESGDAKNRQVWEEFELIHANGASSTSSPQLNPTAVGENPAADGRGNGPRDKLNTWLDKEHDLHREHRGVLQAKPARTAAWLKDNIKDATVGAHGIFNRKPHEQGVEKES